MKNSLLFALVGLLGFPLTVAAAISGDCSGCHTMHNSEENAPVAKVGIAGTLSSNPIANLLKFDCIACHAQNTTKIVDLNGSDVPQVYHNDASGDLAAGNFRHITDGGASSNRKGHNVIDLFPGGDTTGGTYTRPPGFYHLISASYHDTTFGTGDFSKFTCAGAAGCHGTRHQLDDTGARRVGKAAISGAHHQSTPGKRDPVQVLAGAHDGAKVAAGYRFIPGLKGIGNTDPLAPWQNAGSSSHNEYFGVAEALIFADGCNYCHVYVSGATNNFKSETTSIRVPNQSMSGFCSTCHGDFHSAGTENGSSGAFLRHPSDFIIPAERGYEAYTAYNITAPVARNATAFAGLAGPSGVVNPGSDMVMCLSCHKAHASEYDAMLRFDYATMTAGGEGTAGCLACHTNK